MWKFNSLKYFIPCHRRPDRSFFWRGKQFPLCARCTGLYGGGGIGLLVFVTRPIKISKFVGALLLGPMYIDGITQLNDLRESTNILRLLTGLMGGVGLALTILNELSEVSSIESRK